MFVSIKKDFKKYNTMLLFLIFFTYISGLVAQAPSGGNCIDMTKKPVMCEFRELYNGSNVHTTPIEDFPCECEVMNFQEFCLNNKSVITVNKKMLKKVANFKPTIVTIQREMGYTDWVTILGSTDGLKKEVEILIKFAQEHNIAGYKITQNQPFTIESSYDPVVSQNLPLYIQLLKAANLIVGVLIMRELPSIKNPCITDFATLNPVTDYYEILTFLTNTCEPDVYNGQSPIKCKTHGADYQLGMEEITAALKTTAVDLTKIYYTMELYPTDTASEIIFNTYVEVCTGSDFKTWCVQNTNDFFLRGQYAKTENAGINIKYPQLDDVLNTCGCGNYIAVKNILAGYTGGSVCPCPKVDVQKAPE